jgi:hypothetical protein
MTSNLKIKRQALAQLIKEVGEAWGEPIESIREYAKEILDTKDIDKALACFTDLAAQAKLLSTKFRGVANAK